MEKRGITHGPSLELLQFMVKDVDLMEEIQMDAKEIMQIPHLLEHAVQLEMVSDFEIVYHIIP